MKRKKVSPPAAEQLSIVKVAMMKMMRMRIALSVSCIIMQSDDVRRNEKCAKNTGAKWHSYSHSEREVSERTRH